MIIPFRHLKKQKHSGVKDFSQGHTPPVPPQCPLGRSPPLQLFSTAPFSVLRGTASHPPSTGGGYSPFKGQFPSVRHWLALGLATQSCEALTCLCPALPWDSFREFSLRAGWDFIKQEGPLKLCACQKHQQYYRGGGGVGWSLVSFKKVREYHGALTS